MFATCLLAEWRVRPHPSPSPDLLSLFSSYPSSPSHVLIILTAEWQGGFLDRDSFMETLAGWGKTVVTGRARLGGIPVGVIAVETQTTERVVPADPADCRSQEEVFAQPAQVWFPDSSYKTAQAIQDFNNGEQVCFLSKSLSFFLLDINIHYF